MAMGDGRTVDVKMTVKETISPKQPNPLYTIETMEVEPASVLAASTPGQNRNAAPTGSTDNIGGDDTLFQSDMAGKRGRYQLAPPVLPEGLRCFAGTASLFARLEFPVPSAGN